MVLDPDLHAAWSGRCQGLLELGRYPEALDNANAALAIHNEDPGALYVRSRVHIEMGLYKRATTDLNRYLLKYPDDVEARCYRGLAKEKAGNRKGARKDYARAYRIAEEIGDEDGAALVIRLFPELKQRKARR